VSAAKLQTAVMGATGYAGFELAKLLLHHPKVATPLFLSREAQAQPLESHYPELSGDGSYPLESFSWELLKSRGVDVLFLATPHELSRELVPEALARGLRIVDLSGAWRLKESANRAVYGFTDHDAGVSGAGKKPTQKTHFVEAADNFSAYSVFGHRHTGEILEQAGLHADELIFTPHLLPIPRGILSTIYLGLTRPVAPKEIEAVLREFYGGAQWIRIFEHGKLPQIQYSVRTNYCDVGFQLAPDGKRLIVVSCLDNLMKGAAGQALQNLNVMFGWSEKEGF